PALPEADPRALAGGGHGDEIALEADRPERHVPVPAWRVHLREASKHDLEELFSPAAAQRDGRRSRASLARDTGAADGGGRRCNHASSVHRDVFPERHGQLLEADRRGGHLDDVADTRAAYAEQGAGDGARQRAELLAVRRAHRAEPWA